MKNNIEVEIEYEKSLRPKNFNEYIGQEKLKKILNVSIEASKIRGETLDHTLFFGPPGLGKTTLANIIANEMKTNIKVISAPMIEKSGDLASILTNLQDKDILFIDEIHRLNRVVEEVLYSAMEDFHLDILIGSGSSAQSIKIDLPKFTLIGATTRAGMISNPLRDRFGIHFRLQFYTEEELMQIVKIASQKLNKNIEYKASEEIAKRSRGTPRIALKLLKRVRDFADVKGFNYIDFDLSFFALNELGINQYGLDELDIEFLTILMNAKGKAVGLNTISSALREDSGTIEDVIEPYLIANRYIEKTSRGRVATNKVYEVLKF